MAEIMGETEAFALVKKSRLVVCNLHEDDAGMWFANVAQHFRSPLSEWRTGQSKVSAGDAIRVAIGYVKSQATAVKVSDKKARDREDLI